MGKNQSLLQFGVGSTQQIDRLEVSWPSGHHQQWTNVDVDSRYLLVEGQTELFLIQQE